MSLAPDELALVKACVSRFRFCAGLQTYPVDLDQAYRAQNLPLPEPLHSEMLDNYLPFQVPKDDIWRDGLQGAIDLESRQVSIFNNMSTQRRRFIAAHELMHDLLRHNEFIHAGFDTPLYREAMEDEANAGALELLAPEHEFSAFLRQETPAGGRTGLLQLEAAARLFGLTLFTAARRHVETTTQQVVLIMLRPPRDYRGEVPRDLWLRGWSSQAWKNNGCPPVPEKEPLSITSDPAAVAGFALLRMSRDDVQSRSELQRSAAEFLKLIEYRFQSHGIIYVSPGSINVLLTGSL